MKKILSIVLISGLAFSGCKKKDKDPTKSDILVQGKWKLSTMTFNNFDITSTFLKDCQKDNLYVFNTDKSITVDEGATKCSTTAQQTYTDGSWSLLNNDAQISISGGTITAGLGSLTGDLAQLTSSTLQIKKDTSYVGIPGSILVTFTNTK